MQCILTSMHPFLMRNVNQHQQKHPLHWQIIGGRKGFIWLWRHKLLKNMIASSMKNGGWWQGRSLIEQGHQFGKKGMMATMQGLPTLRRSNMNGTHINLFQLHCIVINDKQLLSHQCCNRWIRTKHISSFQDEMTYIIWNWCELRRDRKQDNIWAWWLNHFIIVDYIYLNRYVLLIRGVAKITYFLCASSVIGGDQKTHHSSHQ